jgi:5-methylthioribose kinase
MWQLSRDNAVEWLRLVGLGDDPSARVEALSGGVSGVVLRAEVAGRWIVLKQACERLRTREAWFSDPARIFREQEVMDLLQPLLPAHAIPRVLFIDRERGVLAMEHAPEGATPWKARLLAGELDADVATQAGRLLGMIHRVTAERREELNHLRERSVFVQLRVDPFYRKIQERHPDLAGVIEPLVEGMLTRADALCHGDFSPKNLLVQGREGEAPAEPCGSLVRGEDDANLTLVDHETAHLGDPAMDVGFFFSHLVLKAMRSPTRWAEWNELIHAALQGYGDEAPSLADLDRRSLAHLAVCLLARVDGTSPVDYLPDERTRNAVRWLGRLLLLESRPVSNWNAALYRVGLALGRVRGR